MATVLSQIVVDENDPAFQNPTKFIGPIYTKEEVEKLGLAPVKQDGDHFRKVVPSPLPVKMIDQQMRAVELLTNNDCVVICAGGGGIPVIEDRKTGQLRGIEAVIDKDRAATMVAKKLNAKGLIILTDVEAVATGFGTPEQKWIKSVAPEILKTMMNDFPPGSMGPKVESAIDFVEQNPGGWCAIGSLKDGDKILSHQAGTIVTTDYGPYHLEFYGATHEDPAEAA
jgi:carbamate kinase